MCASTLWARPCSPWSARSSIPDTGEELPDNTDGEFCARGYNIMKGYYKMPEATAAVIDEDGWLHSGDVARRTPDGYYKITGRIKDMIIRGGENIYPKEIEEFFYTHPAVKGRAGNRRAGQAVRRGDHGLYHPQGGRDRHGGGNCASTRFLALPSTSARATSASSRNSP